MLIIGDIHGRFQDYVDLLLLHPGETSIQVGDFGIGFPDAKPLPVLPEGSWFIRGNHDNPCEAYKSSHYLGDFGFREIDGYRLFYLSGAFSTDEAARKAGVDWWPGEQLSLDDLKEAVTLYTESKPDIVITHDGPDVATDQILRTFVTHKGKHFSRTAQALNRMFDAHQPQKWLFGHWHVNWSQHIGATRFQCVNKMEYVRL